MIALKSETKTNLENLLGLKLNQLDDLGVREEIAYIEKNLPRNISFSKRNVSHEIIHYAPVAISSRNTAFAACHWPPWPARRHRRPPQ